MISSNETLGLFAGLYVLLIGYLLANRALRELRRSDDDRESVEAA
jgi:hypothetical protein